MNHPWSRDPAAQAAIRRAEADTGPTVQHHEVPRAVEALCQRLDLLIEDERSRHAAMSERVARLEASAPAADAPPPGDGWRWLEIGEEFQPGDEIVNAKGEGHLRTSGSMVREKVGIAHKYRRRVDSQPAAVTEIRESVASSRPADNPQSVAAPVPDSAGAVGFRTERVTLEVTWNQDGDHTTHLADWFPAACLGEWFAAPGESVRVVPTDSPQPVAATETPQVWLLFEQSGVVDSVHTTYDSADGRKAKYEGDGMRGFEIEPYETFPKDSDEIAAASARISRESSGRVNDPVARLEALVKALKREREEFRRLAEENAIEVAKLRSARVPLPQAWITEEEREHLGYFARGGIPSAGTRHLVQSLLARDAAARDGGDETARLTAERDAAIRERDEARNDAEHDVREVLALARKERDAALARIRELEAAGEPVAWAVARTGGIGVVSLRGEVMDEVTRMHGGTVVPLYATPQQERVVRLPVCDFTNGSTHEMGWYHAIGKVKRALDAAGVAWEVGE